MVRMVLNGRNGRAAAIRANSLTPFLRGRSEGEGVDVIGRCGALDSKVQDEVTNLELLRPIVAVIHDRAGEGEPGGSSSWVFVSEAGTTTRLDLSRRRRRDRAA